jgi:hypothetical protein
MNKKLIASALLASAAFVSTTASADVLYDNSVGVGAQTSNALVNPGGTARANDLTLEFDGFDNTVADSEIIIRLPAGLNFSAVPIFEIDPAAPNSGLTLKDNTEFGDPTRGENAGVEWFDTNADGGYDRAVVTVSSVDDFGDMMTINVSVTANADATIGTKKASIIVNGGLAETVDLVDVTDATLTGVGGAASTALVAIDQEADASIDVTTPVFTVSIPAGAENGDTVTLDVEGKVQWDVGVSDITITDVFSPVSVSPLTGTAVVGSGGGYAAVAGLTSTVTMTVQGAPTGGFTNDVVVELQINSVGILEDSAVGEYGVVVAGTAGASGTAKLLSVAANGSSAALKTGDTLTSIVVGSSSAQELAGITITENFDGDATKGTSTITITAGTGLSFAAGTSTITISDAGATINVAGGTSTSSVIVLDLVDAAGTKTITIQGIYATASAEGELSVTVGGVGIDSATGPEGDVVSVATGVPVGTVSITAPSTLDSVGPTGSDTADFSLNETTYGAITRSAYSSTTTTTGTGTTSSTTESYFRVTPSNATIDAITVDVDYESGAPAFGDCDVETAGSTSYVCTVTAESSTLETGTNTVTISIDYTADGDVGDVISMSFDGNAGVAGSGEVATIVTSTTTTKGEIPIVSEGTVSAQTLAPITITENHDGALGEGTFRLLAPAGVVFDASMADVALPGCVGGCTATEIVSTFAVGDTLQLSTGATPSVTVTPKVIVASNVHGYLDFAVLDGTSGATAADKTGLTEVSAISLGYADKSLTALDAGDAIAVNVGFSAHNTISGGLVGDGYTVKSNSSEATASASISGHTLMVTGHAAGSTTIVVEDELGGTADVVVTVSAGAEQSPSLKTSKTASGATTTASFTGGVTIDGGDTFATEFTAGDEGTVVGTVNIDPDHVGLDGEIHVAIKSNDASGVSFSYVDEDGQFADWDLTIPGLGPILVGEPLAATHTFSFETGAMAAGTYNIYYAYSAGGELVYTKALTITVTE